jgi:hypothetical protein
MPLEKVTHFFVFIENYETFHFDVCFKFNIKIQVLSTSFMFLKQARCKLLS